MYLEIVGKLPMVFSEVQLYTIYTASVFLWGGIVPFNEW